MTSARTGSASTPRSTTTRRSTRSRRSWTAIPDCITDVQTYLKERIREVLAGIEPRHRRPYPRHGPGMLRSKAKEIEKRSRNRRAWSTRRWKSRRRSRRSRSKTDLAAAQRYGLKPGDVRRAASALVNGEEVGDIYRDGKALRHPGLEPAGGPRTASTTSATCCSTPRRASRPARRRGHGAKSSRRPTSSSTRTSRAHRRRAPTSRAATSAPSSKDVEPSWPGRIPAGVHAEMLGESRSVRRPTSGCSSWPSSPPSASSSCCTRRSSACGWHARLPDAADRPRRRRARRPT